MKTWQRSWWKEASWAEQWAVMFRDVTLHLLISSQSDGEKKILFYLHITPVTRDRACQRSSHIQLLKWDMSFWNFSLPIFFYRFGGPMTLCLCSNVTNMESSTSIMNFLLWILPWPNILYKMFNSTCLSLNIQ